MVQERTNYMPKIIPINELKNTATISKLVEESDEPIFVTKNGYGSMVMMSIGFYEREMYRRHVVDLINESLEDLHDESKWIDGIKVLNELKEKYRKK
jgi:PHD/YefM family antitoxin component YafN of YafNO toxin-antitoxin module